MPHSLICSICGTHPEPVTERCACPGYAVTADPESRGNVEGLFASYLAARLTAARREARAAAAACERDPEDRSQAAALRRARQALDRLELQFDAQGRRVVHPLADAAGNPDIRKGRDRLMPDDRICPRCSARVPGAVRDCRCGYEFTPQDTHTPAFLSDGELFLLRHRTRK